MAVRRDPAWRRRSDALPRGGVGSVDAGRSGVAKMDSAHVVALLAASSVNAALPGPGMVFAIGRSASAGTAAGLRATAGMLLATLILLVATFAVLRGLMPASPEGGQALRWFGATVLAVLAALLILGRPARPGQLPRSRAQGLGDVAGGLILGLTSPLHLVFLLALVPQFVDVAAARWGDLAIISLGIVAVTAIPMIAVSLLGAGALRLSPRGALWLTRAGGAAMLGFAGLVLVQQP